MDQNQGPNNILQFPKAKREGEGLVTPPSVQSNPPPQPAKKPKANKKQVMGSVLAVVLFTAAVNSNIFSELESKQDLSSHGRGLASVQPMAMVRDAKWEMQLAESLASAQLRAVASTSIGRMATKEEKLRWGILEEKYTINYQPEQDRIASIALQDMTSSPAYILDRSKFLGEYGSLFESEFDSARLTSVIQSADKIVESYVLYNKANEAKVEAKFELDKHKRLISLKVQPVQI